MADATSPRGAFFRRHEHSRHSLIFIKFAKRALSRIADFDFVPSAESRRIAQTAQSLPGFGFAWRC